MPTTSLKSPAYIAKFIRRFLKDGGSAPHAESTQRFFKQRVQTHGWKTPELRKVARRFTRQTLDAGGPEYLLEIADRLFRGSNVTEHVFAVLMLEPQVKQFTGADLKRFEGWLQRIVSWVDHDGLVHYLIGPILASDPKQADAVLKWAGSQNRWHRRAAAVALVHAARKKLLFPQIVKVTDSLLDDEDDMVQKGVGWLLRESAKATPKKTMPYLRRIRDRAPRLVLRTACETLTPAQRASILGQQHASRLRKVRS